MLERVLEALQGERLTPFDVRIMLRVSEDEMPSPDIAAAMGHPPSMVRRASRRLVARGLLRRRRRPGRPLTITLGPTDAGTRVLQRIGGSLLGQAVDVQHTRSASAGRRVVVGYDGSDAAKRALDRGAVAVGACGTLTVVSVRPRPRATGLAPEPFIEAADDPAQLLAEARRRLAGATTSEIRTVAAEGNPPTEIANVARSAEADLIVIGRNGGRFMSRAIFGSVAVRVVELSRCDVLVVA
jgi:nucleotide-binding universal stress UspA family protein